MLFSMPERSRMSRNSFSVVLALGAALIAAAVAQQSKPGDLGFTDTPLLPGLPWHVHDPARPHPKVVTPGEHGGQPPSDAVILFDGKDLSRWTAARLGSAAYTVSPNPAPWRVAYGYFEVIPRSGDIAS